MEVKFAEIITMPGLSGLHRIVKADLKGIIIESLDAAKKRQLVRANMMVSKLSDISMYVDSDESVELRKIFQSVSDKYATTLPVHKKSSNAELMDFLGSVLPTYDKERVYPSNVKKLVEWYAILTDANVSFAEEEVVAEEAVVEEVAVVEEEKPKKKTAKAKTTEVTEAPVAEAVAEEKPKKKSSKKTAE